MDKLPPAGPALRRWLKRLKLTRAEAATMCGVSPRQFARYCLPLRSRGSTRIPKQRWTVLVMAHRFDKMILKALKSHGNRSR